MIAPYLFFRNHCKETETEGKPQRKMSEGARAEPSGYALWRQEFPDFKLVAETGEELPCHKVLIYVLL